MNSFLRIQLNTTPAQAERLSKLQAAFAEVCNALSPVVQQTRCWNRVALHHLAYKPMRERFPGLGSQMICNAIYSVSRTARRIYQHPSSPFNVQREPGRSLPLLRFLPQAPVYFDRHTLSIKDGRISMYTLDGRMRFTLGIDPLDEQRFHNEKLREVVLTTRGGRHYLSFHLRRADAEDDQTESSADADVPEYLVVLDQMAAPSHPTTAPTFTEHRAAP